MCIRDSISPETQINLTLSNSKPILNKVKVLSSIISTIASIYGKDDGGQGYLEGWEIFDINNRDINRWWMLNEQHQLKDIDSNIEIGMYDIMLNYSSEYNELELTILSFNELKKRNKKIHAENKA